MISNMAYFLTGLAILSHENDFLNGRSIIAHKEEN